MDTDVTAAEAYQYFIEFGMLNNLKSIDQEMVIALINRIEYLDGIVANYETT